MFENKELDSDVTLIRDENSGDTSMNSMQIDVMNTQRNIIKVKEESSISSSCSVLESDEHSQQLVKQEKDPLECDSKEASLCNVEETEVIRPKEESSYFYCDSSSGDDTQNRISGHPLMENIDVNMASVAEKTVKPQRRRRIGFLGDFTEEDMDCPRKARLMFNIAKSMVSNKNKEIKYLNAKLDRLRKRVQKLQKLAKNSETPVTVTYYPFHGK